MAVLSCLHSSTTGLHRGQLNRILNWEDVYLVVVMERQQQKKTLTYMQGCMLTWIHVKIYKESYPNLPLTRPSASSQDLILEGPCSHLLKSFLSWSPVEHILLGVSRHWTPQACSSVQESTQWGGPQALECCGDPVLGELGAKFLLKIPELRKSWLCRASNRGCNRGR